MPKDQSVNMRGVLTEYLAMGGALLGLIFFFGLSTEHFLSWTTFQTIANQIPDAIVIAVGMTFVLIIAGIDLSVGSVLAFSGAVLGVCIVQLQMPLLPAALCCLGAGILCGTVNGLIVIRWSVPSFIVTLGMMEIARGGAYMVTRSQTQYIGSTIEVVGETSLLGLSLSFLIALCAVIVGQIVLTKTVFGRHMIAIGTNEEAVRLSGIDTRPVKIAVFCDFRLLDLYWCHHSLFPPGVGGPQRGHRFRAASDCRRRDRRHQPDGRARICGQQLFRGLDHCRTWSGPGTDWSPGVHQASGHRLRDRGGCDSRLLPPENRNPGVGSKETESVSHSHSMKAISRGSKRTSMNSPP